jgi:hypothetical protein
LKTTGGQNHVSYNSAIDWNFVFGGRSCRGSFESEAGSEFGNDVALAAATDCRLGFGCACGPTKMKQAACWLTEGIFGI